MGFRFKRNTIIGRLPLVDFTSKHVEIQILPNPYARIGSYEIAIDCDGFRIFTPTATGGWSRGVGFHWTKG